MHYYQFHIGDYAAHTRHLSLMEDLALRRLLDYYYLNQKPIVAEYAARKIGMPDCGHDVLAVLVEFFEETPVGYINHRADKEIESYTKQVDGGKRGAEKRWGKPGDTPPIATQLPPPIATNNHKPITNNQISKPLSDKSGVDSGFTQFWKTYPSKVGKSAAETAWRKAKINGHLSEVLQAVEDQKQSRRWREGIIPNPATWINQKRWLDELEQPRQQTIERNPWDGAS